MSTEVAEVHTWLQYKKFAFANETNVIIQSKGDQVIGTNYITGVLIEGQTEKNIYVGKDVTKYLGKLPV